MTDIVEEETAEEVVQQTYSEKIDARIKAIEEATGFKATREKMSVLFNKPGHGPIAYHCSTIGAAVEVAERYMLSDNFRPLLRTKAPVVTVTAEPEE